MSVESPHLLHSSNEGQFEGASCIMLSMLFKKVQVWVLYDGEILEEGRQER